MTAPLTPRNHQTANIPPSSSLPSYSSSSSYSPLPAGPAKRVSICSRMSHSLKSLGEHAESPVIGSHASAYSSHSPSSAHPPTLHDGTSSATTTMSDPSMDFAGWGGFLQVPEVPVTFSWQDAPNPYDVNESVDLNTWMPGSGSLAADTNVAVSWKSAERRAPEICGLLDKVETLLPHSSAPVNLKEPGGNASTNSAAKGKRSRSQQGNDDSDEGESQSRKMNALPAVAAAQSGFSRPLARPHRIFWEVRDLKDDDFEYSCEWCPFFIHQPLKYDSKPWNSCSKQRAESSHIVTHIVADHGIIRGHNTKRATQRYLTQCARNDNEAKGKLDCAHCQEVQNWTEEQKDDRCHAGKSVCLRCYEELPTKRALFEHLQERSICLYREDLPMRRKSRILYSAFCSSSDVPRFRPPPETAAPRDGARKRNMKSNNRPRSTDKTATQNRTQRHATQSLISPTPPPAQHPARSPSRQRQPQPQPQPTQLSTQQPQIWSSPAPLSHSLSQTTVKSEFAGDISGNYYPAPSQTRNQPQPQRRMPFAQPTQPTRPASTVPPLLISRQVIPSVYSDFDNAQHFANHFTQPLTLAQSDIGSDLGATPLTAQPQQHSPAMQVGGSFMGKPQMYPAHDSGYSSQNGGDHTFVEDYTFTSQPQHQYLIDPQYHQNPVWLGLGEVEANRIL